jgi:RNA-directed DNA polymerase
VVAILTPIYEAEFLGFSYGFRPGRGQHDALDALAAGIARKRINWILDADLRSFLDMATHCTPAHASCSKSPGCGCKGLI